MRGRGKPSWWALASVGATAGLAAGAVSALLRQGAAAARIIENAALSAVAADGLLRASTVSAPESAPATVPIPRADGVYYPDGRYRREPPETGSPDAISPSRAVAPADVDSAHVDSAPVDSAQLDPGRPLVLAMMGDSLAVGYGCGEAAELPGVRLARGIAEALQRSVRLVTLGQVGAGSADLPAQLRRTLPDGPDLVVLVIGANDIRDKVGPHISAGRLELTVAALRAQGIPTVVPTCPDYGVIRPIPMPLRAVLHAWSDHLARLQARVVGRAGGRSVALGRLVGPVFAADPEAMFFGDGFHPSGAGYARTVATILPVALQAIREDGPESTLSAQRSGTRGERTASP